VAPAAVAAPAAAAAAEPPAQVSGVKRKIGELLPGDDAPPA
jgi:hypothetical protein